MNKKHVFYLGALVVIYLIYFSSFLNLTDMYMGDFVTDYHRHTEYLKQSVEKYHTLFPLWDIYGFSGSPHFAKGKLAFDSMLGPLILIFSTTGALKLNYLFNMILAGLSMYALMFFLTKNYRVAFVSALLYGFNGWVIGRFMMMHLATLNAYFLPPLVMIFLIKAFREKQWLWNAMITGFLLAIEVRVGPDLKILLFNMLILGVYVLVYLVGPNIQKRLLKATLISIVILFFLLTISAQRVIPMKEYIDESSRAGLDFEKSASRATKVGQLFGRFIEPLRFPKIQEVGTGFHIGIIGFLLALYGVYTKRKSKFVWFLTLTAILTIFVATGSFVYYLIWKFVPGFKGFRYLTRSIVMFIFPVTILAGFGFQEMLKKVRPKKLFFLGVVTLIILNLMVFGYSPYREPVEYKMGNLPDAIQNNHILQNISKMPGIFRIQTYETRGIDWGTGFYNMPLGIEHIFEYDSAWFPPYFNGFLTQANANEPRFWGMLNTKYITVRQKINVSGFKFVEKFKECDVCFNQHELWRKAYGPYLYENEQFLPRAFFIPNSILIIGDSTDVVQTAYAMIHDTNLNPATTVIITAEDSQIQDKEQEWLNRFDIIFLVKGAMGGEIFQKLSNYQNARGILIPDVLNGEQVAYADKIQAILRNLNGTYDQIDDANIETNSFEKKTIHLNKKQGGFLVLSEKYAVFPGWSVKADGKNIELLTADIMLSAVYVDTPIDKLVFEYKPKSFILGTYISYISFLIFVLYGINIYLKRKNAS